MIEIKNDELILKTKTEAISLLNGGKLSFSYTLKSEDIRNNQKTPMSPYQSHKACFDELKDVKVVHKTIDEGIEITIKNGSSLYSEWGINLPFNFMGKKNGGGYQNQYLFSSPYKDSDGENNYLYLSNPNGHNLLIVLKNEHTYWKMDYSPYCGGHFFINLKLLGQFDKLYDPLHQDNHELVFYITEVKDFSSALEKVNEYLDKPVLSYDLSGGKISTKINIKIHGNADYIFDGEKKIKVDGNSLVYEIKKSGIITLIPYYENKKGLECTLYGYKSIADLYNKSIHAISFDDIAATDGNLCEHQCYVSATLRYLLRYGTNKEYEAIAKKALNDICQTDIKKAKKRITILDKPQDNGYPSYHVFGSNRIQEQFFGVTILLDAYKYFKDEKYLRYATKSLNTLIDYYQREDGGFYTKMEWNENYDDYSTVTCPIIPLIDMAIFIREIDSSLSKKYEQSARKLAEHIYLRGLSFPTESLVSEEYEREMEDGSISCSALSLLYFYNKIEKNNDYLIKAKEILDLHECWIVQSPLCNAYRSSLRWWETGWEGDRDGPALCLGHAWSIWRGEADFWMFKATGEKEYLLKSLNTFNTNFAKINDRGESFSIYCIDYITGGGFGGKETIKYHIAPPFSKQKDSGLSRYLWIRADDTIIDYLK